MPIRSFVNKKYFIGCMFCVFAGVALYNMIALRFTVDDAYITMRYSRHLAEGYGPVYNIGERVEGYTNFLWMLMLGTAYKIGFDMPITSHVLGICFSLLTLVMALLFSLQFTKDLKVLSFVPVCILANNRTFTLWATGGLETALFTLLLMLVMYLSFRALDGSQRARPILAFTCLLLTLTRPEGLMLSFLMLCVLCVDEYVTGTFRPVTIVREWSLFFVLPLVLYLAWKLYFYHDLLPNTFYNKVNSAHYFSRGMAFFSSFVQESWILLWVAPVVIGTCCSRVPSWVKGWLLLVAAYVFYTVWVGGDWMDFRFYAPILPVAALLLTWGLCTTVSWILFHRQYLPQKTALGILSMYGVLTIVLSSISTYMPEKKHVFDELATRSIMHIDPAKAEEIAQAYKIALKPDEVIAHSFAGFSAVYTDNRVIDILGQNDAVIARQKIAERHTPGHEKGPPPGYLEKNQVICIYPWVMDKLCFDSGVYSVRYLPGKYLKFNSTWSQTKLAKRFEESGFPIYYEGIPLNKKYAARPSPSGITFDFETGTYQGWTVQGKAFGTRPAYLGKWTNSDKIKNTEGNFFISSFSNNNDTEKGKMLSASFEINEESILFLIGGGRMPGIICVNLLVNGIVVRSATGNNSEELKPVLWDVKKYKGKMARLQIVDNSSEGWGHILVDSFQQISLPVSQ